ncbi:hypothetical protein CEY12_06205 [Chryseobacterium sp. T16E-39]|uniref:hypothetical protein n=1 Tax=Chryseobacterium sp. T16E-39 TaxID=2015076 RepID=UPI000B5B46AD|nr:hypothetical protein [Chryseobacterium sp. T16E-39]ASK29721.1 hypothetical protein CEY12_06205 [Chryseobacterium sp. T16E-39]
MSEVKYSLNDKNFKDYGVYVSESIGLVGLLERKNVTQYDWAEYHGISPDLKKPKYKERIIELKCFIRGDNWEVMFDNFMNFVIGEFSKPGTQRLHIEPLGFKTLPYEVFAKDEVKPEKTFKDGVMYGIFSLKFIEPNPIKTVLKTSLDKFKLSYKIDSETEIFFGDGTKQIGRGDVSLTKDYAFPSYQGSGISVIEKSSINDDFFEFYSVPENVQTYSISIKFTLPAAQNVILYVIGRKPDNTYEVAAITSTIEGVQGSNSHDFVRDLNVNQYGKFIFKILDTSGNDIPGIVYNDARIETAEILGEWKDMTGKEKIIIIAGNIEEMKELSTAAQTIWEKI